MEQSREVLVDGSLGDGLPVERDTEAGVGLSGGYRQVQLLAAEVAELPPCPGPGVVQPAVIPGPPLIRLETPEDDRVQLLLTAYGLVCAKRLPGVWNPYGRPDKLKAAERKLLVAAAEALCNHQVSPLRWVEFSFDQWEVATKDKPSTKKGNRGPHRPPLRMLFSPARIEEHGGWCRHERERRSLRVSWTRSLRTLMSKWQAMRAAILRGEVTVAQARARYFPGDSWERQVARAQADARQEQARIDKAIAAGDYLW